MTAASGADQPTLRDQLAETLCAREGATVADLTPESRAALFADIDALLPLIEADRERAKAEGGAEALEKAAREDHTTVAKLTPIQRLTCVIVKTEDMVIRAAALRGSPGGAG